MKLLAQLSPLESLRFPSPPEKHPEQKYPLMPAIEFVQRHEFIRRKRQDSHEEHNFLRSKYCDVFGVYPKPGISYEVVRARIVVRLQYEGHRLTNTTPAPSFLQNYNALMRFNDNDPWEGCTNTLMDLGTRLSLMRKDVEESDVIKPVSEDDIIPTTKEEAEKLQRKLKQVQAKIELGKQMIIKSLPLIKKARRKRS